MTKSARWAWLVSLIAITGAGGVLVFLLSIATNNRALYERHYVWLFWLNVAVALLLGAVIVFAAARLVMRRRKGKFGSRLLLKLAGIFALVGVVPGVLIYTVSYQFVSRSIESWFDVRVEGALDAGLNLGRATLDAMVSDLSAKTRLAAERLGESRDQIGPLALERLREQLSARDASVLGNNGQVLFSAAGRGDALMPERAPAAMLRQVRSARVLSQLEGLDEENPAAAASQARVRALALIPNSELSWKPKHRSGMWRSSGGAFGSRSAYRTVSYPAYPTAPPQNRGSPGRCGAR